MTYIGQVWKSILKIGYDSSLSGLERSRTMLLNGLTVVTCISVVCYSIGFKIIGYQYYLSPLLIILPGLLLLLLNKKQYYRAARNLYALGSLLIISFWLYEGRRNGNEYILIGVAITSALIFNKQVVIYLINLLCIGIYVAYKYHDLTTPFTPDPALNYDILPTIILISTVGVITFQMAFFRDLAKHYDNKLLVKYKELDEALKSQQTTEEELMATNEELSSSNEQLYMLTNQLEIIVKQKSAELQSYVDAINVNIHSAVTDSKGIILRVNQPLLNASGYTEEELVGKDFNLLNSSQTASEQLIDFWKASMEGKTWRGEIKNKSKDGAIFWTDTVILPVKGANEAVHYFLTLSLPITERKLHEESREKTIELIETIAFRTSHNIRGPLTRIHGLTNLVQNDLVTVEEFKWIADKIHLGTQEIDKVTTELVEFLNTHQRNIQKK
jgi:PAS domain S-box-containing protein